MTRRSWFASPTPWVVIFGALLLVTLGTFAFAQDGCDLEVTHEERVECYLSALVVAQDELVGPASLVGDALPALMVLGSAAVVVGLVRGARLR